MINKLPVWITFRSLREFVCNRLHLTVLKRSSGSNHGYTRVRALHVDSPLHEGKVLRHG